MKTIQIILILFFINTGLNAQTQVSLYDSTTSEEDGVYYKDMYNDFDVFVGTWVYTSGTTSLTITLQKKIMQPGEATSTNYYEDVLVGGYRYVVNGVEKVNTLPNLQLNLPNTSDYNIFGNILIGPNNVLCNDCSPNKKVRVGFWEPNRDVPGLEPMMQFQRADVGTVKKLKLEFYTLSGGYEIIGQPAPQYTSYSIPFGNYVLTKQ